MRQTEFHISYKILEDRFLIYGASLNVPLSQILTQILKQNPEADTGTKASEYKVLVAKQVVDPPNLTLKDLDLTEGDYLLIYKPQLSGMRLRLIPPKPLQKIRSEWVIDSTDALIGRADDTLPDIDLTPMLQDPLKISRKLAWLKFDDETWTIILHEDAHSVVYVDQIRLEHGSSLELNNESVISFGGSLAEPDLTLKIALESIK